jgi:cell division protein FtsZ
MNFNQDLNNLSFDLPKNQSNVIKVIGVGGGGSNAINHMYSKGIKGVDYVVCNTDAQALENSNVPNKIQLGVNLTEGLGAGANPIVGEKAAIENLNEIKSMLENNTKMVFITAGMGGGTGTGAAPIISKLAMEMNILTVGIVTMPFVFEGKNRISQANIGLDKLRKNVDALIVVNNNK